MASIIFGCGDVGRRIAKKLIECGIDRSSIIGYVRTAETAEVCSRLGVLGLRVDLDSLKRDLSLCQNGELFYTVAPPKVGIVDSRTENLLRHFVDAGVKPAKVVLISTTGVYGDCAGEWVTEQAPTQPSTDRGKRRLDSERRWLAWGKQVRVPVVILRVPGIYAYSRLPRERLKARTPVVHAHECGFTNRVHADDLASICVAAMHRGASGEVYNASDGTPGTISEFLQAAAHVLGMDPLPEISMQEAQQLLSDGMLSYLSESRKISNAKLLNDLSVELNYPDFMQGIKY
ncbi:SDR family oxidoreductase [Arenicella xantha]|uniref:Nucleoside-diphosphate-sugar epimerase n=1 Tax=Arenicella xantha TaxID=644221 RepID=A0A395JP87_9GAMM|nr:SDR family oxidoreductase [Arenicella xantha]RBP53460.1 nucleoside-diphosphate-sugar epimerase [Arenicella xantha]